MGHPRTQVQFNFSAMFLSFPYMQMNMLKTGKSAEGRWRIPVEGKGFRDASQSRGFLGLKMNRVYKQV